MAIYYPNPMLTSKVIVIIHSLSHYQQPLHCYNPKQLLFPIDIAITEWNFRFPLTFISLQQYLLRGELLRSLKILYGSESSRSGAGHISRCSPDSPALGHVMYFSTNGEAYQVFYCNVETHEDWMETLQNADIIYTPLGVKDHVWAGYLQELPQERYSHCLLHPQPDGLCLYNMAIHTSGF